MVEIDQHVIDASKAHFPKYYQFDNPKLSLHIDDGIEYVKQCAAEQFDLVIIDGSDPAGPAEGLFSESFYKDVHRILNKDGMVALQSESPMFHTQAFLDLNVCLSSIFGNQSVSRYLAFISTYPTGMWSLLLLRKEKTFIIRTLTLGLLSFHKRATKLYTPDIHLAARCTSSIRSPNVDGSIAYWSISGGLVSQSKSMIRIR